MTVSRDYDVSSYALLEAYWQLSWTRFLASSLTSQRIDQKPLGREMINSLLRQLLRDATLSLRYGVVI